MEVRRLPRRSQRRRAKHLNIPRATARQATPTVNFHYVYILESTTTEEHFYVGLTEDLHDRLRKHNAGEVSHTSKFKPWNIKNAVASGTAPVRQPLSAILNRVQDAPLQSDTCKLPSPQCSGGLKAAAEISAGGPNNVNNPRATARQSTAEFPIFAATLNQNLQSSPVPLTSPGLIGSERSSAW